MTGFREKVALRHYFTHWLSISSRVDTQAGSGYRFELEGNTIVVYRIRHRKEAYNDGGYHVGLKPSSHLKKTARRNL